MKENPEIQTFLSIKIESLPRNKFGEIEFDQIKPAYAELRSLITEMIDGSEGQIVPIGIQQRIIEYARRWNGIYASINNYNLQEDAVNSFRSRGTVIRTINEWHQECTNGFKREDSHYLPSPFFATYAVIKSLGLQNEIKKLGDVNKLYADFQTDIGEKSKDIDSIMNGLRATASESIFLNYSRIFIEESEKHSSFKFWEKVKEKTVPVFKVGAAEKWILAGLILVGLFALLFLTGRANNYFPIVEAVLNQNGDTTNIYAIVISLLTRLLIISIWIYLITFCFRQFSVNKHLATVNKHRANALNSYKLFVDTIGKEDAPARHELMLQVAKAIYEQTQTGHLSKQGDAGNSSIIELTRLINPNSKS